MVIYIYIYFITERVREFKGGGEWGMLAKLIKKEVAEILIFESGRGKSTIDK